MKIAIMSDSHDNWGKMVDAINIANDKNAEVLLHAGDLIAPPGIDILEKFKGEVKYVWGNNEAEKMGMTRKIDAIEKITLCGDLFEGKIDNLKILMNHYPRYSELAALSGEFDLCVCGHTHEYREEYFGEILLLNTGEIQGHRTGISSFVIFDTVTKKVK